MDLGARLASRREKEEKEGDMVFLNYEYEYELMKVYRYEIGFFF